MNSSVQRDLDMSGDGMDMPVKQHRNRVIVLEFNELTPRLMSQFIDAGVLPNFARLRRESTTYLTDAGEDPPHLNPWIQWVTAHSGVPLAQHQVVNLGDATKSTAPSIWEVVSDHGGTVWVCGSMNAAYKPGVRGLVLPDPWSVHVRPSDAELAPYFEFVRAHVLEYTRDRLRLGAGSYLRFVLFMLRHGLSLGTAALTLRQLSSEFFGRTRWRRATILDRLQFDLFGHYYRKLRPDLSTFFVNSTAHFQHVYWRNFEPAHFQIKPTESDQRVYRNAVRYGYRCMDTIVGKVLAMAGDDATVVFATALSQQPCLSYESVGGKIFHKPHAFEPLLRFAGIDPASCAAEPVMSEEFHLRFSSSSTAERARAQLLELRLGAEPVMKALQDGASLMTGCAIFHEVQPGAPVRGPKGSAAFDALFYEVDTTKSGMHHRDGMLWIRPPKGTAAQVEAGRVPLESFAPTILTLLGLHPAKAMQGTVLLKRAAAT
jgi:hypothetical protein